MQIPSSYIINTAEEAQALDVKTTKNFGIDAFTLMEVAGYKAAEVVQKKTKPESIGLFLCGKGNNGGDALVAARYLVQQGYKTTILFVSGRDSLSSLAQKNYELLQKIDQHDEQADICFIDDWDDFGAAPQYAFIVDGMLGTGLNSDLRGAILKAVKWSNEQSVPCIAMDIPTGLHADSGKAMGTSIKADHTCSFGTLKQGFYLNDGYKYRGEVHFCELPFPDYLKKRDTFLIDEAWLPSQKNEPAAHKYEAGVVYIIGGSEGLTGAAIMAARSAWQEGLGAVILVCPHGLLPIFENNLPEVIKKPVGAADDYFFKENHLEGVSDIVQQKEGTVLIGPGIGRENATVSFVNTFLGDTRKDCVVDADALWALSQQDDWTFSREASQVLTPHPGELSTLLGETFEDDLKRMKEVRQLAAEQGITVLSKGFPVMTATKDEKTYVSGYDSRNFSRAGFGDVLAGKIAAFSALNESPEQACMRALLSGENKLERLKQKHPNHAAEPKDIL